MKDLNTKHRREYYQSRRKGFIVTDWSVVIASILVAVAFTAFLFAFARAIDVWAVQTCIEFNDCDAVYATLK